MHSYKSKEMKKIYTVVVLLMIVISSNLQAQQESLISQYTEQMSLFNPAAVSIGESSKLSILHRRQWQGVADAPTTTSLTYGFYAGKNVGLGLSVITDKVFIEQSTFVGIDYSYRLQLDEQSTLYLGLKGGGNFYSVNTFNLRTYGYVVDPSLNSIANFTPNIGFGAYYTRGNFYLSLGSPRLLSTERATENNGRVASSRDRMHYYSSVGYDFIVNEAYNLRLRPSIFARSVIGSPSSVDFNTMLSLDDKFTLGATYRTSTSFAGIVQLAINPNLMLGWTYEVYSEPELTNTGDTMEFLLSYKF